MVHVADLSGRRSLHSARSSLLVTSIRLSIVVDRTFPIVGSFVLNNLQDCDFSATLSTFCQRLKTYLFSVSFPDNILD